MNDKSKYLSEGPLTKVTPRIIKIADSITGEGIDLLFNISNTVNKEIFSQFEYVNDEEKLKKE